MELTTLLHGPSNLGKTHYALAHFTNPLLVSHIDRLKQLSPDHDGVVFDDMSFRHWPIESVIHLVDKEFTRDINVRYGTIQIPSNTKKIFTYNTAYPFYNSDPPQEQMDAVNRRVVKIELLDKLF